VVLLLDTGKATALLTGDIERSIAVPERVDVLKVSHHGSRGVRVRPMTSVPVVSVGANNPFGHPHPQSLPALRTDQLGAITVTLATTEHLGRRPILNITGTLTETCCSCKLAVFFGATIHKDLKNLRLSGF
jgi:beta-lactamase superfamily II metal-dependent hydrolase